MQGFAQDATARKLQRRGGNDPSRARARAHIPAWIRGGPLCALAFPQPLWVLESFCPHPILITPTLAASDQTLTPSCLPGPTWFHLHSTRPPSIWPPDGSQGLLTESAAPACDEGAPHTSPPLWETGTWAEEEANAGGVPTMCQTRSQTPSLWFNILLTPQNTSFVECY